MLNKPYPAALHRAPRARQRGVALLISLIVLVAMTLAAIAMVRSADTTNVIAGNLAFKQAAVHSGDLGIEAAIAWLELNNGTPLWKNDLTNGYQALRQDPALTPTRQTWDDYWVNVLALSSVTLATDAAGNTASYSIQRMCNAIGDPISSLCSVVPITVASAISTGNSQTSGSVALQYSSQVYYRITSRVVGPRNTVSYVQAVVAL
jgi:Tfp pilus assembly protein PilX